MLKSSSVRASLRPKGDKWVRHGGKALRSKAFSKKNLTGKEEKNADF